MIRVLPALLLAALPLPLLAQESAKTQATPPPPAKAAPAMPNAAPPPGPKTCADHVRDVNEWIDSHPAPDSEAQRRAIILRMRDRASSSCAAGSQEFAMRKIQEVRQMLGMPKLPTEVGAIPPEPPPKPGRPGSPD